MHSTVNNWAEKQNKKLSPFTSSDLLVVPLHTYAQSLNTYYVSFIIIIMSHWDKCDNIICINFDLRLLGTSRW